jgi:hypothetical protein
MRACLESKEKSSATVIACVIDKVAVLTKDHVVFQESSLQVGLEILEKKPLLFRHIVLKETA